MGMTVFRLYCNCCCCFGVFFNVFKVACQLFLWIRGQQIFAVANFKNKPSPAGSFPAKISVTLNIFRWVREQNPGQSRSKFHNTKDKFVYYQLFFKINCTLINKIWDEMMQCGTVRPCVKFPPPLWGGWEARCCAPELGLSAGRKHANEDALHRENKQGGGKRAFPSHDRTCQSCTLIRSWRPRGSQPQPSCTSDRNWTSFPWVSTYIQMLVKDVWVQRVTWEMQF